MVSNESAGNMSEPGSVVVIGMGEVGQPLSRILGRTYSCLEVDIHPVEPPSRCSVLHVCYPFQIPNFVDTTVCYIEKFRPEITVINSTVAPGTTTQIAELSRGGVAYSPVRGKHARMEEEMLYYAKFVGADDPAVAEKAGEHFTKAGFHVSTFPNSKAGEVAKLLETTWLGILVSWAQEIERIGAKYDATYEDVSAFFKEIAYLPHNIFPGFIGGHCVMPNIAILRSQLDSDFLDAVVKSNEKKMAPKRGTVTGSSK